MGLIRGGLGARSSIWDEYERDWGTSARLGIGRGRRIERELGRRGACAREKKIALEEGRGKTQGVEGARGRELSARGREREHRICKKPVESS